MLFIYLMQVVIGFSERPKDINELSKILYGY